MESDFIEQKAITIELRMLVGDRVEINLWPNVSFANHAEEIFDLVTGNTLLKLANSVETESVAAKKITFQSVAAAFCLKEILSRVKFLVRLLALSS